MSLVKLFATYAFLGLIDHQTTIFALERGFQNARFSLYWTWVEVAALDS
jgi:hypothetical protein